MLRPLINGLSPRRILASMNSAQPERAYFEFGQLIQVNRMCLAAATTWLVYDFLVIFDQEVEYIWKQSWSISTFLYLLLRYFGSAWNIFSSAALLLDHPSLAFCKGFVPLQVWPPGIIVSVVEVMLQMRLYVLYKRSNKFFASLAICFLAKVAVLVFVYSNFSSTVQAGNHPVPGVYACYPSPFNWRWILASIYLTLAFESILCGLCIWAGYQCSKEQFSATGLRWSRAYLIDILVGGSVLYFICFALMWVVTIIILSVYGWKWGVATNAFCAATSIIGGCRLILHLRKAASSVPHARHRPHGGLTVVYRHLL